MKNNYSILFILLFCSFSCQEQAPPANALVHENSPYLLQHAHNPVDWYPWKEEALKKAEQEDKLLIISIGYAACHWCHVMEEESFQDTAVANLMNEHFVSIKVDREERPDVDEVYMTACQMGGGSCGWPLNAIALPDGRPVWAGTYFPKKQWMEILRYFIGIKNTKAEQLDHYANRLLQGITSVEQLQPLPDQQAAFSGDSLNVFTDAILGVIDFERGGIKGQLKFPMPATFAFLLEQLHAFEQPEALEAVNSTLTNMAKGGLYDQLGGGFARYSTDPEWTVPHFEKMLYDNAQLVSLYAHAYQVTQNPFYEAVIRQTLQFIERELTSPEGGFYSSINADSEGEEGRYYVWQKKEVDQLITDSLNNQLVRDYFGLTEAGNWEEGKNVLAIQKSMAELSASFELPEEEIRHRLEESRNILFKARETRVRPSLDDKMLTSWNALMITGYLDAFRALSEPAYKERAIRAAVFLSDQMLQKEGRLDRNFKDGQSGINAFLDDYALTTEAFLALYELTFDVQWLNKAKLMNQYAMKHFKDEDGPVFFYTSELDPPLITRKKQVEDNVIPAANSVMGHNLLKLGLLLYDTSLINRSRDMVLQMMGSVDAEKDAVYFSNWARLYLRHLHSPYEVVIIGADHAEKRDALLTHFLPNCIFLGGAEEGDLALLQNKKVEGKTMIYVCKDKVCKLPVESVGKALELIE